MGNKNESGKPSAGPWVFDGAATVFDEKNRDPICNVDYCCPEEDRANGRLIAAAPCLLAALIRTRDDLNNAAFLIRKELGDHHWLYGIEKGKKIADEAIARARGLSQ